MSYVFVGKIVLSLEINIYPIDARDILFVKFIFDCIN